MDTWSEESLLKLKVKDLKEELKKVKQPVYGTKILLIQRLLLYKENQKDVNVSLESESALASASGSASASSSQNFCYNLNLENVTQNISDVEEDVSNAATDETRKTPKESKLEINYEKLLIINTFISTRDI